MWRGRADPRSSSLRVGADHWSLEGEAPPPDVPPARTPSLTEAAHRGSFSLLSLFSSAENANGFSQANFFIILDNMMRKKREGITPQKTPVLKSSKMAIWKTPSCPDVSRCGAADTASGCKWHNNVATFVSQDQK